MLSSVPCHGIDYFLLAVEFSVVVPQPQGEGTYLTNSPQVSDGSGGALERTGCSSRSSHA